MADNRCNKDDNNETHKKDDIHRQTMEDDNQHQTLEDDIQHQTLEDDIPNLEDDYLKSPSNFPNNQVKPLRKINLIGSMYRSLFFQSKYGTVVTYLGEITLSFNWYFLKSNLTVSSLKVPYYCSSEHLLI